MPRLLRTLPMLERRVIAARYGLIRPALSRRQTAAQLGLSRRSVAAVEQRALDRLRSLYGLPEAA